MALIQKNFRISKSVNDRLKDASEITTIDESDLIRDAIALYLDLADDTIRRRQHMVRVMCQTLWEKEAKKIEAEIEAIPTKDKKRRERINKSMAKAKPATF